jgi:hypothetical protein
MFLLAIIAYQKIKIGEIYFERKWKNKKFKRRNFLS